MLTVRGLNAALPLNARITILPRELHSAPEVRVAAASSAPGLCYLVFQCLFGEA